MLLLLLFCFFVQDNRFDVVCCIRLKGLFDPRKGLDVMHTIMTYFANIILHPFVRPFVMGLFCLTSTFSLASLFNLQIGLDQNVALPKVCVGMGACVYMCYTVCMYYTLGLISE